MMPSDEDGLEIFGRADSRRAAAADVAAHAARSTRRLGLSALAFSALTIVMMVAGYSLAVDGKYAQSTNFAYLATGASVVAVIIGVAAIVRRSGRVWGAIAIVVAVGATPIILTRILAWAGGLG